MTNPAIYRKEYREQIVFTSTPSPETCKPLRKYGFDFDRRTGQWFRVDVQGTSTDEQAVVNSVAA